MIRKKTFQSSILLIKQINSTSVLIGCKLRIVRNSPLKSLLHGHTSFLLASCFQCSIISYQLVIKTKKKSKLKVFSWAIFTRKILSSLYEPKYKWNEKFKNFELKNPWLTFFSKKNTLKYFWFRYVIFWSPFVRKHCIKCSNYT